MTTTKRTSSVQGRIVGAMPKRRAQTATTKAAAKQLARKVSAIKATAPKPQTP